MYEKQSIGKLGERLAGSYLEKNSYKILDRNFNCMQGEIDIVAYDVINNEVVFVEVKTRTNFNYGFPSEAVNNLKQKHMLNSARYYLYCKKMDNVYVRFDVIEVVINEHVYKLNHLKDVIS